MSVAISDLESTIIVCHICLVIDGQTYPAPYDYALHFWILHPKKKTTFNKTLEWISLRSITMFLKVSLQLSI